ncbi:MAG: hypothetical protein GYA24_12740 [Candidatus Lokiarchaeota archaeon]|nr:hypothetical protein [Candidatus Lokiarchaeota archaeon]
MVAIVDWLSGETQIYKKSDYSASPRGTSQATGIGVSPDLTIRATTFQRAMLAMGTTVTDQDDEDHDVEWSVVTPITAVGIGGASFRMALKVDGSIIETYEFLVPSSGQITWSWVDETGVSHKIGSFRRMEFEVSLRRMVQLRTAAAERGYRLYDVSADHSQSWLELREGTEAIARFHTDDQGKYAMEFVEVCEGVLPGTDSTLMLAGIVLETAGNCISFVANIRAYFDSLLSTGMRFTSTPAIGKDSSVVSRAYTIRGELTLPASWMAGAHAMTQSLDSRFTVVSNEFCVAPHSAATTLFCSPIPGGVETFVSAVNAFRGRFGGSFTNSPTFSIVWRSALGTVLSLDVRMREPTIGSTSLPGDATIHFAVNFPDTRLTESGWNYVLSVNEIDLTNYQSNVALVFKYGEDPTNLARLALFVVPAAAPSPLESVFATLVGVDQVAAESSIAISEVAVYLTIGDQNSPIADASSLRTYIKFENGKEMYIRPTVDGSHAEWHDFGNSQTWFNLLPSSGDYGTHGDLRHNIPARPFVAYTDNAYSPIRPFSMPSDPGHARFDEWLVHHLLGETYEGSDVGDPRTIWDNIHPRFLEACNMAGISISGNAMVVDATAMRWFLLWAANAGNYDGSGQSFGAWLQSAHGMTISEAVQAGVLYSWFAEWASTSNLGYILPR